MKISVVLAGQARFSIDNSESLREKFLKKLEGEIKIYCSTDEDQVEAWKFFLDKVGYDYQIFITENTPKELTWTAHDRNPSLYPQYNHLRSALLKVPESDMIVKTRADFLYIDTLPSFEVRENEFWVPEKEFHNCQLFDKNVCCNDQICIMGPSIFSYYRDFLIDDKVDYSECRGPEDRLRRLLRYYNIQLKTFNFLYIKNT